MTQKQRLLEAFKNATDQTLSMGHIERELYLSQGNARLKELKEQGYEFKDVGKDEHGFKKHKLIREPDLFVDMGITDKPTKPQFGSTADIYRLKKRN